MEAHQGYVGVEIEKSPLLVQLHEEILKVLAPLRALQQDNSADYGMSFNAEQIKNLKKYGYADAMELYSPHFTITRLKDEQQAEEAARSIQWDIPEFIVTSLGVFVSGDHGTCKALIREFKLDGRY